MTGISRSMPQAGYDAAEPLDYWTLLRLIFHMASSRVREERSSLLFAVCTAVIIAVGFGRTFFLRWLLLPTPLPSILIVHGALASLWATLLVVQATLIACRRRSLHRLLGWLGAVLLPLVAVTAAAVLADAVTRHDAIASMDGLTLLIAFDGLHLVLFLAFAFVAMAVRRHPALHRSLILLATINLLPPALGRLFAQTVIPHVELLVLGTIALLTVALVGLEWARSRYVRTEVIGAAGLTVAASLASWWAQTSA